MKICVLGGSGQLGYDLIKCLNEHMIFSFDKNALDITNKDQSYEILKDIKPDFIIHAAGYTDVSKCERNPYEAYKVNVVGTENIVNITEKINSKLVYISSDYVFDGEKGSPYHEYEVPNPINQYGKTKYASERFVQGHLDQYYIVRTGALFGSRGNNFIKSTLSLVNDNSLLRVVDNQITSIAYTVDLSKGILDLIEGDYNYGIYHFVNEGFCSWYELAQEIFIKKKLKVKVRPISISEVKEKVPKPQNSSLINNSPIKMRSWKEAIEEYLLKK